MFRLRLDGSLKTLAHLEHFQLWRLGLLGSVGVGCGLRSLLGIPLVSTQNVNVARFARNVE